ncbi:IS110 family transposase [Eubacteriales bacterium OttesenSCG-928-G02]|nr:IS110 family transposase [Eubacteriales bacterium OttesenSCG-928-G02]MDL2287414.1 IS110 family transposase [Eubacteriales bacterium OttesenSCG-928-G02]
MIYVGIDVAKSKHDCCILNEKGETLSTFVFANDKEGFEKLMAEIGMYSSASDLLDTRIGLESTGHYSINLQNYLLQKRLCVRIYNPLSVNLLRKAQTLRKTKTDKSDCKFLATLLFSDENKSYSQTVLPISELRNLTRSRHRLVAMRSKLKLSLSRLVTILFPELSGVVWSVNQKSSYALLSEFPTAKDISNANIVRLTNVLSGNSHGRYGREKAEQIRDLARNSIGLDSRAVGFELQQTIRLIQNLQTEIELLDKEIKKIMRGINSPVLSIPGVGYVLGAILVSEIGNIENFTNPAKLLAFAGLEPAIYQSGQFNANFTPTVKRGSTYLRWALMQAARLVAYRDGTFAAYLEKKLSEGKHFYVALTHVAKKLVRVVFHLLKTNQNFAPQLG